MRPAVVRASVVSFDVARLTRRRDVAHRARQRSSSRRGEAQLRADDAPFLTGVDTSRADGRRWPA